MTDFERIKKDVVEMDSRANVCWYDTKVLTKAVRLILEELTADRKPNCSEKPNNCKTEPTGYNLTPVEDEPQKWTKENCKGCKYNESPYDSGTCFVRVCINGNKYEPKE